jgi:hypothetical protein
MQQSGRLQNDGGTKDTCPAHEQGAQAGDDPICGTEVGRTLAPAIEDEQLMTDQYGLGDNGTESTRPRQSGQGDDQMKEYDSEVAHPGNGINSSKTTALRPIWQFAIDSSRNWTFRVPKKITVPASPVMPMPQQIDSVDFDVPRMDVIGFTFSLPVFWAVVLAAPGWRRNLRPFLAGTGLIALVELSLLLTFAATSAHKAAAAILSIPMGVFETWLLSFSDYLTVLVVPYLAPIVVAFAVHHELRRDVFGWSIRDKQAPAKSSSNRNSSVLARKTARRINSFYKRKSQEKKFSPSPEFFLLSSPVE